MSFGLLQSALGKKCCHLSPFLVLGDPTPNVSVELAKAAVDEGVSMLEIGFPYGDPVADGPAIQDADSRSLRGGTSTGKAIDILARIRDACPITPLNLLVYGNLVHARGYERFCVDVVEAGASSLLVPDIPLDEGAALMRASRRAGLGHVELVGPLTRDERLKRIDRAANAFVYLVAHQGVTGVRDGSFESVMKLCRRTSEQMVNPLCLGFGLSRPEHIEAAFQSGARLAVVGSHLARIIGRAWNDASPDRDERVVKSFTDALRPLVAAAT
jgi:tryptophan synthase alpha chain